MRAVHSCNSWFRIRFCPLVNGNMVLFHLYLPIRCAGPRTCSAVGSASDSRAKGPGFDTRLGHLLSFLLPLFQERQLSVTGEGLCTKYWLTLRRSKSAQEKCG